MKTGSQGTFVISWSQTETDGLRAATLDILTVGAAWRWTGAPVRVDGPQGLLVLTEAEGMANLRKRGAGLFGRQRLVGHGLPVAQGVYRAGQLCLAVPVKQGLCILFELAGLSLIQADLALHPPHGQVCQARVSHAHHAAGAQRRQGGHRTGQGACAQQPVSARWPRSR